jgi:RecA/RadA recombinase
MSLIGQLKGIIGKDSTLGMISQWMPSFNSGFDLVNYRNGIIDPETRELSTGLDGGKILTLVGKSGSGKSTLGVQIAGAITGQYKESQFIHLDFERAGKVARLKTLTGWNAEIVKEKYLHMDRGISTESVFKLIKAIAKLKKENSADLLLGTGVDDEETGKEIMMYPPTVILLDSLALMAPDTIEEGEEMKGQMSATAIAKANTQLFKRIVGPMMDTNIMLIVINHITTKVDINPMAKTQAQVNFLKQDETLPGGAAPIYLSNYLFKLVTSKKLTPDKEFGIKGFEVNLELVKSRSAAAGLSVTLLFDQDRGFNNVLSNFLFLKDQKLLKGSGKGYFFDFAPDVKFSQKTFIQKYEENAEFAAGFDELVKEELYKIIPQPEEIGDENGNIGLGYEEGEEQEEEEELVWNKKLKCYVDSQGNKYDEDGNPLED